MYSFNSHAEYILEKSGVSACTGFGRIELGSNVQMMINLGVAHEIYSCIWLFIASYRDE